jgi:uncharacterized phage protein gp47/JayE
VSKSRDDIETGDDTVFPGWAWRVPGYWPGGVRHGGGASLVCGSCTERGKAGADTAHSLTKVVSGWVRGSASTAETGGVEYQSRHRLADRLVVAGKLL